MGTKAQSIQLQPVCGETENQRSGFRQRLRSQFGKPTGFGGKVAGWIMAHRPSNRERNVWAVSLLELQPTDHVLEIGFGPGVAINLMSQQVTSGHVVGVDHSEVMLQQATKRNASAIEQGRVQLLLASMSDFPVVQDRFDKCLMVNAFHFWDDPGAVLRNVRRVMNPGGKIVVAFQPRFQGATDEDTLKVGHNMVGTLKAAGFSNAHLEIKSMAPVSVACAVGLNEE